MSKNKMQMDVRSIGRLDQNVVRYPKILADNYGEDANLVMSVLSYLMANFKNNLFGYTTFTLSDFCKKYGYHKKNLCARHPDFIEIEQQQDATNTKKKKKKRAIKPYEEGGHVFISVFDHVLYRMMKENVIFSEKEKDAKYLSSTRSLQLIRSIKILNKQTRKGTEEHIYEVTLGNEIFVNAFRHYTSYNEVSFIEAGNGKNGLGKRQLYLYILAQYKRCLVSKIPCNTVTPNYSMLCMLAGLNAARMRDNKPKLIGYLDEFGESRCFDFTHNLKEKWLDDPQFEIIISFKKVFHYEGTKEKFFFEDLVNQLQEWVVHEYYTKKMLDVNDDVDALEKFQKWLENDDANIVAKATIVIKVFKKHFKKDLSQNDAIRAIKNKQYWQELFDAIAPLATIE